MNSPSRTERLAQLLDAEGIDAYLAWSPVSMGYLRGFFESGHERFLTLAVSRAGDVTLIAPALSAEQARRSGIVDVRPWRDGEDPLPLFRALADAWNLRSGIIAVDNDLPAHMLLAMQEVLPAALFKKGQPILSELMRRKDDGELELLRRAAQIADDSFEPVLAQIRPGMTEQEVEARLKAEMQARGGKPTFAIVATGALSAEPHHHGDDTPLREGDIVIIDFGCDVGGYQSDITRTVAVGHASDEAAHVYDVVLRAHHAAREVARAGVECQAVDAAAREVIEAAGYGEYFVHRTGHGIGMRGHEEPYIVTGNATRLEEGDCFSVEPGIYLPGNFGVRIENIVTATAKGCESLNSEPASSLRVIPV